MAGKFNQLEIEDEIIQFWANNDIVNKVRSQNDGKKPFYFLDGPPYTSGKIHLGTAWNKALKDSVLRYKRMQGFDVWDRAGYDMHGLPTENATQKKLKLSSKEAIEKLGIDKFIDECRNFCVENMNIMNKDFQRLGVWMDFDNAYQSITKDFMDGEWWLIKKAHEKGRLYRGLRTMTWCAHAESALAKHELEYKTVVDKSIFVKFKVKGKDNEYIIIWTTTPWTIPFNLAVMVNPSVEYVKIEVEGSSEQWIVAGPLVNVFMGGVVDKKYKVLDTFKGEVLEGLEYEHPFQNELGKDYDEIKSNAPKTHTVLLSEEYVDTSSGSGLVHCAPGCGPEDYEIGHKNGIPPYNTLTPKGVYPDNMGQFSGLVAKKDDEKFIEALESAGALVATKDVEHDYPHDWRYHEPVIFRTTKQWFFKVEDIKDQMVKENEQIKWQPHTAFNAFDSWLKNIRDNSISKQRYWGTPLPIWINQDDEDDYLVIGSSQELEELSGQKVDDLHIPTVDKIIIEKDGKTYKRIPDVLDVWVDAGTTSWNCLDFMKDPTLFNKLFPADFILEGKDQIRGWFNLLMVASMIAHEKPSFKSVYMHGFVQDSQGRKMSKSSGNVISPFEVVDKMGADTLRYYMIGGANPGLDINYNPEDVKVKYKNLSVLWNVHSYLLDMVKSTGVDTANLTLDKSKFSMEERHIISKTQSTIKKVTQLFEEYHLDQIPWKIEELYLELSRTYLQLTRDKVTVGSSEDKELVVATTYFCMVEILKLATPIMPFITEKIYLNLKEVFPLTEESLSLHQWPKVIDEDIDQDLEKNIETVQNIIQAVLAARDKAQLGVRWPCKEVVITTSDDSVAQAVNELQDLIKTQTNVKEIKVQKEIKDIKTDVKCDFKKIGPDFGPLAPKIIAKLATESAPAMLKHIEKEGKFELSIDDAKVHILKDHILVEKIIPDHLQEGEFRGGFAYLNKERTKELEGEGFARELMRRVQSLRKTAGLQRTDRIDLLISADEDLREAFDALRGPIMEKVGADAMTLTDATPKEKYEFSNIEKVKGKSFEIFFNKI